MNRHYVTLLAFYLFSVSGCATKSTQRHQYINESAVAESFSQNGQHKQAASVYQTLATAKPTQRDKFNLLAAKALTLSGDSLSAQSIINSINPNLLNTEQRNNLNLLLVQIFLSQGDTEKALNALKRTQPYSLSRTDKITFYQSLAFAHSLSGDLFQSVQARIQLSPLLESAEQRLENNSVILDSLGLLSSQTLTLNQSVASQPLDGWLALANLIKHVRPNQSPAAFQLALSEWQRMFPSHPANTDFIQSFSTELSNNYKIPQALAILLPESGRFAKAASAIKAGLMAAYHQSHISPQPSIRFYDTSSNDSVNLYLQAVAEGAELVIGPLSKENIQNLALSLELTTPVLALNHIPNLAKNNLFQFGLSPIDDVKQITRKASADGIKNILILTPETNHGHRMADYLSEYWLETGGTVLETQHYVKKGSDFSVSIKNLLNLNESTHRYKKIKQRLVKNIQYTERRRQDVDAIFLSATAGKARSVYPQLQFYRATQVPVYALPQIYTGEPNPSADVDLNSITFCDIPWLFPGLFSEELNKESLRASWQDLPYKYLRLIALGIDSFNLTSELEQLNNTPFPGATGTLSINMDNRITRQLVCAKFINGQPVIQETIVEEEEEEEEENDDTSFELQNIYP